MGCTSLGLVPPLIDAHRNAVPFVPFQLAPFVDRLQLGHVALRYDLLYLSTLAKLPSPVHSNPFMSPFYLFRCYLTGPRVATHVIKLPFLLNQGARVLPLLPNCSAYDPPKTASTAVIKGLHLL